MAGPVLPLASLSPSKVCSLCCGCDGERSKSGQKRIRASATPHVFIIGMVWVFFFVVRAGSTEIFVSIFSPIYSQPLPLSSEFPVLLFFFLQRPLILSVSLISLLPPLCASSSGSVCTQVRYVLYARSATRTVDGDLLFLSLYYIPLPVDP